MSWPDTAPLVEVPDQLGTALRIDATEVTRAQYRVFLDAVTRGEEIGPQPDYCLWNDSFDPDEGCLRGETGAGDPDPDYACDNLPAVCVDWCDARAYCDWAGKRLCGAIVGGPVPVDGFGRTSASEWLTACSAGGDHDYAFGDIQDAARCNTADCITAGTCYPAGPRTVGSLSDCESPNAEYRGVFDLAGNVAEWENACEMFVGAEDGCVVRGGFYAEGGSLVGCYPAPTSPRSDSRAFIGFRCCAD